MDEKPQSYAEWLREPDASWPKERLRRSQQAHQNALYVENLALTPTTTVREMQPYGERVGIKVRSKKDFAAVHQAHRELAAEAEGRALESYPHLASTRNYKPKMSAPAQKSEPRAAILARGILAAVELRKSLHKADEHAQQPGETFGIYAHRHAKRWAQERAGLAEPEAEAYARHFVSTYPEGLDESGHSIDHPIAYQNWQEQSAPRASHLAPAPAPPRLKSPRKKPVAVPSGKITWMHGQRPK